MAQTRKDRIVESLIEQRGISKKALGEAVALQKKKGIGLDRALIEKGLISETDFLLFLSRELNIPMMNLNRFKMDPSLKEVVGERVARQYKIVPISVLGDVMTVAVSDPFNVFVIDDLKSVTGKQINIAINPEGDILKAIHNFYEIKTSVSVQDISKDLEVDDFEIVMEQELAENLSEAVEEGEKAPIIRMVNLVIEEAIRQRASDIHIEPTQDNVRVRYRIDGTLRDILDLPKENQNAIIVRIKIMSLIDITASQIPQDGRFKLKLGNKAVDFRVSLLPTTFGQKIVMRILDKGNLTVGLNGLGFNPRALELLEEAIRKPFGMILVTGPTGSGKSTTLYSIINELNTADRNIITVEDPVEYLVEGLTQIQVHSEIGLTFAEGLRSILRQSPDIVMVGEIRDNETADIAIKASLTGQLVLSTIHTNDASGALTRLVDMGVEPFLVGSSLILVSAQRLCRKICPHCKEPVTIDPEVLKKWNIKTNSKTVFFHGKGCDVCHDTGYLGRLGITEILEVDDTVREMLLTGKSSDDIKRYAQTEKGMATLWEDALDKCFSGLTSLEEVLRLTASE